jgi:predicted nucleic acid-binding protein
MIYLDSNVVVAATTNQDVSEKVQRLLRVKQPFYVSRLADYEARKAMACLDPAAEGNLDRLLAEKFRLGNEWDGAIIQALKISRQFKRRLCVDSADTLHVGWAMSVGADVFASFDRASGPRALALCLGLELWPEPRPKDFETMKRLKG